MTLPDAITLRRAYLAALRRAQTRPRRPEDVAAYFQLAIDWTQAKRLLTPRERAFVEREAEFPAAVEVRAP